ncbi:MAG TPA: alpha/beta hydrolase [Actinophytocola sp.]|uniref:alpha/beta hydrolase n=1 Tax=Actinophytocola sp. TaxID=1872138 RepID=UPI002DB82578|nr:alpha/beta hydrolase [Actinophytocola sp.]HEU5469132.1 alpha/beta hydrolase [Actinophytocola sp.]
MPLDPQVQAMRDRTIEDGTPPLYTLSIEEARAADLAAIKAGGGAGEPVHEVTDRHLPGPDGDLPIRIYRPRSTADPLPTVLYFFGGGWTLGSIETSDGVCRSLANAVPCQVITIGYRLAPEHRFPAAVSDCYAAACWIAGHAEEVGADPARLAVAGDSAGGNLAAAVTLLARQHGEPALAAQVLVYPNTDYRGDTGSMRDNDDPALFNRRSVAWYWKHYLSNPDDGLDPLVSPLRAESLSGLPPALVLTAEYDPLRDEGEQYADRLSSAGVAVESTRYTGMPHGFFTMSATLAAARDAHEQVAAFLRMRLETTPRG